MSNDLASSVYLLFIVVSVVGAKQPVAQRHSAISGITMNLQGKEKGEGVVEGKQHSPSIHVT